jgi:tetratricopeptide (TPR) repeat protein
LTYANEIDDLDLWWHLRTGRLIYETWEIPQKDYFSYTTIIPEDIKIIGKDESGATEFPRDDITWFSDFPLRAYWISQLIFYGVYLLAGFKGIGLIKSFVFVLSYLFLYLAMLKRGAGHSSSLLVLLLIAIIGMDFNYSRPQMFSFLLFAVMLYMLYDFRRGGKGIYFVPVLMLLWSNLHGGFILGIFVLTAFTATEFIRHLFYNVFSILKIPSLSTNQLKTLSVVLLISSLASIVNPNGFKAFLWPWVMKGSTFLSIEEYFSPMLYEYHAYWFMLFLVIISMLISVKKKILEPTELIVSLLLILPSLSSIRFIMFFALGTGIFLAYSLTNAGKEISEWCSKRKFLNLSGIFRTGKTARFPLVLSVLFLAVFIVMSTREGILRFDTREGRYPSGAVAFLQKEELAGNMFNLYNWGGYLIWSLYPDYRVFIDGRNLNKTAFFHYRQILNASRGNDIHSPLWKRLLNAYRVNFILTTAVSSTGNIIPLVDAIFHEEEWEIVYLDGKSMIFLRDTPGNKDIIQMYGVSKEKIYDEIIDECRKGIAETPATWGYYRTLGYVYMKQFRLRDALRMFQRYLAMNPDNEEVKYSYNLLTKYLKEDNKSKGHTDIR